LSLKKIKDVSVFVPELAVQKEVLSELLQTEGWINGLISCYQTELDNLSYRCLGLGFVLLTAGLISGAVWANEAWGSYWSWDPKETWALVSVLVYATILHLRFIPGLKSKFVFNLVSFWGYSAILFTFFGVNFVLVGLHSYAQGDGLGDIPSWIIYTIFVFIIYSLIAFWRKKTFAKSKLN